MGYGRFNLGLDEQELALAEETGLIFFEKRQQGPHIVGLISGYLDFLENDLRAYVGSQVVSLLVSPHLLEARHALRSLQPAAKVRRHVGIESLQHGR